MRKPSEKQTGFTIVELLVVIVVIGILAAVTIVAYSGVQQKATVASLSSDLTNASKLLKLYQVENGTYPTVNDCSATPVADSICLKASPGSSYTAFQVNNSVNPQTFCLNAMNSGRNYNINSDGTPVEGTCSGVMTNGTICPAGFIVVPGNSTFGTSNFCTMKYEAKNVSGVATSQATGVPWVSISQTTTSTSTASAACTGCHLISEAEWLTIAHNVVSVASNWSGGAVGSGYVYSGHNDTETGDLLEADQNDTNGYSGTGQSSPSNQRRTLTLTNREVIWDLAGNVWEWTTGTITGNEPARSDGTGQYDWKEWNTLLMNGMPALAAPSYGTPAASSWGSAQGIGQLQNNSGGYNTRGFVRGGTVYDGNGAGVFALGLYNAPHSTGSQIGFRVSR
ncbi:prepilin-type N-terminal cleavage/methylation domain-containing protein [Candidatus Saccharibacteria bacterium]|nr:prepilin-type N-terminal cleavage/methylation domain-containing protein [Candidatus Saccharibacteria bacterium]